MTTHSTSAMLAPKDAASVGRATLAMLVPSEGSSIAADSAKSCLRELVVGVVISISPGRLGRRSLDQEPDELEGNRRDDEDHRECDEPRRNPGADPQAQEAVDEAEIAEGRDAG